MKRILRHFVFGLSALTAGAAVADVTFFENDNFSGRQFTINEPVTNFSGSRYNDRARSAIVEGGSWEICVDAEFRGNCLVFGPGRYPNLGELGGRVSSARQYHDPRGASRDGMRSQGGDDPRGQSRDRTRGQASATLFSEPNLTGRAFRVGNEGTSNLAGVFNDNASSLRVESGYWIFCSDSNFHGECRTFGPGDYAALPRELNNRISSGRRISNEYPYSHAPNWH